MTLSPNLLSPVTLGDLSLKNRVVLAPLTRARAGVERLPNALMADYYRQRASAGLLISEATVVSKQGIGWPNTPGIYSDTQAEAWKTVTDAVHGAGGLMVLQLWHCGRASHSYFQEGNQPPVAPSAIAINGDGVHTPEGKLPHEVPHALTIAEIQATIEDYRQAAARAKAAGFDGVEVHGANGYLIDEFLQSKTNQREDEYGGSIGNRYRFLQEVLEAVLTEWPAARVGVRLSPNGVFNDMGSPDYRETFTTVAQKLNSYGLAYLHIMDGLAFGFHELGEPMTLADFRAVYDHPLMGNCGYTQETAEGAIAAGQADCIAFGRPYISNPDLVERFAQGWPLAEGNMETWYGGEAVGYT
ncbi:MAG: alkene reductase, partial [Prochlorothrix sp.]